MTSQMQQTTARMFDICYNLRHNFPNPAACRDEQLYEFWYEMNYKWCVNNDLLTSGKVAFYDEDSHLTMPSGFKPMEETLIDQCCYYEDIMESIIHEINRRPWLRGKAWSEYVGGKRCNK